MRPAQVQTRAAHALAAFGDRVIDLVVLDELALGVQAAGIDAAKGEADALRVRCELVVVPGIKRNREGAE